MSDWQIGDLALCVKEGQFSEFKQLGRIFSIIRIWKHPTGIIAFDFDGVENISHSKRFAGHCVTRFRKIFPDTDPCEEEFTALLKLSEKRSVKA